MKLRKLALAVSLAFFSAASFGALVHPDGILSNAAFGTEPTSSQAERTLVVPPAGKPIGQWGQGHLGGVEPVLAVTNRFSQSTEGALEMVVNSGRLAASHYFTNTPGTLSELTSVSYEYFRASGGHVPLIRLWLRTPQGTYAGQVFHIPPQPSADNTWVTVNASSAQFTYIPPAPSVEPQITNTLANLGAMTAVRWSYQSPDTFDLSSFEVYAVEIGFGSNSTFAGAIDNIKISGRTGGGQESDFTSAAKPAPEAVQPVPTLGQWALMALTGLMGGTALLRRRGRNERV